MKEDFNDVALTVKNFVEAPSLVAPLRMAVNDSFHSSLTNGIHEIVGVVPGVTEESPPSCVLQKFKSGVRITTIMDTQINPSRTPVSGIEDGA